MHICMYSMLKSIAIVMFQVAWVPLGMYNIAGCIEVHTYDTTLMKNLETLELKKYFVKFK